MTAWCVTTADSGHTKPGKSSGKHPDRTVKASIANLCLAVPVFALQSGRQHQA